MIKRMNKSLRGGLWRGGSAGRCSHPTPRTPIPSSPSCGLGSDDSATPGPATGKDPQVLNVRGEAPDAERGEPRNGEDGSHGVWVGNETGKSVNRNTRREKTRTGDAR